MNKNRRILGVWLAAAFLLAGCGIGEDEVVPAEWQHLVKTEGQFYPIPESWLRTPEGKIAHSLKLPDSIPKPVPFDFEKAEGPWYWPEKKKTVARAYFRHLCSTEAGEWTFKKVEDVDGLYFARPENVPSDDFLGDVYGPELPWVEREFQLWGESARDRGGHFVEPPFQNYKFVEEPRRSVKWQKDITAPYIRMFGLTTAIFIKEGHVVAARHDLTPMQIIGLKQPTAKYAYSWRGITRPRDREFRIAGGELIIYDRETREIISVSRNFQITRHNPRMNYGATWMVSPLCAEGINDREPLYLTAYAKRVLLERK